MDLDTILSIISQVGFPIFVAVYVLVRMETVLRELKDSVDRNTVILEKIFEYFLKGGSNKNG
ncbi:MAG: YvrJ family protein [Nitrososphaerota archaeon]